MTETYDFTGDDGKTYTFRERENDEQAVSECNSSTDIPDNVSDVVDILEDLSNREGIPSDLVLIEINGQALDVPIDEASSCGVPMASNGHTQGGGRNA